jgi:putative membrane protein
VIDYDRTNWWRTCLTVHGSVLPHVLGRVGLLTGFCLLLCLLDLFVLGPYWKPLPDLDPIGHTVIGLAISLLIVFRTNTSYARFWEARAHWGALVNGARNLERAGAVYAGPADDLARLVAAYALAVKEGLRGNGDLGALRPLVPGRLLDRLQGVNSPPSVLARAISEWIAARQAAGKLDSVQAMRLETILGQMVDAQGGCERILRTPLPFVYAALIKQVLLLYLLTLPFVLLHTAGLASPLVVAGVSLALLGIEEAGVEIEDPFGPGPNHLPLDRLCETIARDTADLTHGSP